MEHLQNQEQITNIPSQGQIQQILNAAEDERLASQEADDMEQLSEIGQESMEIDDFPLGQDTLGDDQNLLQLHNWQLGDV